MTDATQTQGVFALLLLTAVTLVSRPQVSMSYGHS